MEKTSRAPRLRARGFVGAVGLCAALHGCGALPAANIEPPLGDAGPVACAARVYLLRGLWDIFSLGLDDLAGKLRAEGVAATVLSGPDWPVLVENLSRGGAETSGQAAGGGDAANAAPLVLIGHSSGADDAVRVARGLNERGVPVALLILLDATAPPPLPPNVERCFHFYPPVGLSNWLAYLFAGDPVAAEAGNNRTEIIPFLVAPETLGPDAADVDHFNIEENGALHRRISEQIMEFCRPSTANP